METKRKFSLQNRAVLVEIPGAGYLVRTSDGRVIALTPSLAVDLAEQILQTARASGPLTPVRGEHVH